MNQKRRTQVSSVVDILEDCVTSLESICEEEQNAFDNLPESFRYSSRGEQMEEFLSTLADAIDSLNDVTDSLLTNILND